MITVLAGGVGAGRTLAGLIQLIDQKDITVIVNTGDDEQIYGLYVCPDFDTLTYHLAGVANYDQGWGIQDEKWQVMQGLQRYRLDTWFNLGDKDLSTHIYRSFRLSQGAELSQIFKEITTAWGIQMLILPMTNDRFRTMIQIKEPKKEVPFQEYFVKLKQIPKISGIRFENKNSATPCPGVLEAITKADNIVICPSNPFVSIDPILNVKGIRQAIEKNRSKTIAISPIVAGTAIKGPAAKMMTELGYPSSVVGIASIYAPLAKTLIIDSKDANEAENVSHQGIDPLVGATIMKDPTTTRQLAQLILKAFKT